VVPAHGCGGTWGRNETGRVIYSDIEPARVYDRILVPTDGSDAMETVFDHAADLAGKYDASVHVVHVLDKRAFLTLDEGMKADVEAELAEQGERAVAAAADRFEAAGLTVTTECRSGDPAEELSETVAEADIDLVVMGTERGEFSRSMMGSVSGKLTASVDVPVLVVNLAAE
jgi:nucleotide-binding universal stress UspA family protein